VESTASTCRYGFDPATPVEEDEADFEKNQTVARGLESMPLTCSVPESGDKASENLMNDNLPHKSRVRFARLQAL
jgi:hypothetical protein